MSEESGTEICVCGHHLRAHMDMGRSWAERDAREFGSCSLCECKQFVQQDVLREGLQMFIEDLRTDSLDMTEPLADFLTDILEGDDAEGSG